MEIRSVMVVDDDGEYGELLSILLQTKCSVEHVTQATCGADALAAVRDAPAHEQPQLVLLDFHMPQMDGLATLQALRAHSCRTPCVMISSAATEAEREECLRSSALAFVQKPARVEELISRLQSIMNELRRAG